MSFLKQFAEGFATTASETLSQRAQLRQQEDAERRQMLMKLNAEKELMDHKERQELARAAREEKAKEEARRGDFGDYVASTATTPNTIGTVDLPASFPHSAQDSSMNFTPTITLPQPQAEVDPVVKVESLLNAASSAAKRGDNEAYKAYKAEADIYQARITAKNRDLDKQREGALSVEGLKPGNELFKRDTEKLAKADLDEELSSVYLGVAQGVNPQSENDREVKTLLQAQISRAARLATIMTNITQDESGRSDLSAGEIEADAKAIVRLQYQISQNTAQDKFISLSQQLLDIANRYPSGKELLLGAARTQPNPMAGMPEDGVSATSTSAETSSEADPITQAREALAKGAPREKVIERLQQLGIDTKDL